MLVSRVSEKLVGLKEKVTLAPSIGASVAASLMVEAVQLEIKDMR